MDSISGRLSFMLFVFGCAFLKWETPARWAGWRRWSLLGACALGIGAMGGFGVKTQYAREHPPVTPIEVAHAISKDEPKLHPRPSQPKIELAKIEPAKPAVIDYEKLGKEIARNVTPIPSSPSVDPDLELLGRAESTHKELTTLLMGAEPKVKEGMKEKGKGSEDEVQRGVSSYMSVTVSLFIPD